MWEKVTVITLVELDAEAPCYIYVAEQVMLNSYIDF